MDLYALPASERQRLLDRLKHDIDTLGAELLRPAPKASLSPISTLSEKVLSARLRDGLTQDALADLSGVSALVISKIERDGEGITMTTLLKVCNALGIKIWLE